MIVCQNVKVRNGEETHKKIKASRDGGGTGGRLQGGSAWKNGTELGFDCCFLPEMQSSNEIEFQLQFLSIQFDSTSIKTHATLLFVTLQCTI